jgi:hypothetical protein
MQLVDPPARDLNFRDIVEYLEERSYRSSRQPRSNSHDIEESLLAPIQLPQAESNINMESVATTRLHSLAEVMRRSSPSTHRWSTPDPNYSNQEPTESIDYSSSTTKDLKPPHSYARLIGMAIMSTHERQMTLSNIYKWIMANYAFYRFNTGGWQNSIRHNLSLNQEFTKIARRVGEAGKGMKWTIEPTEFDTFVQQGSMPHAASATHDPSSAAYPRKSDSGYETRKRPLSAQSSDPFSRQDATRMQTVDQWSHPSPPFGEKPSLIVKIKFQKARKEDVQRILRLPSRPDKNSASSPETSAKANAAEYNSHRPNEAVLGQLSLSDASDDEAGNAFVRQRDRKRHEDRHPRDQRYICRGALRNGLDWGCGRGFSRAKGLSQHWRSRTGQACMKPLLDEQDAERGKRNAIRPHADMLLPVEPCEPYPAFDTLDPVAILQGPSPDEKVNRNADPISSALWTYGNKVLSPGPRPAMGMFSFPTNTRSETPKQRERDRASSNGSPSFSRQCTLATDASSEPNPLGRSGAGDHKTDPSAMTALQRASTQSGKRNKDGIDPRLQSEINASDGASPFVECSSLPPSADNEPVTMVDGQQATLTEPKIKMVAYPTSSSPLLPRTPSYSSFQSGPAPPQRRAMSMHLGGIDGTLALQETMSEPTTDTPPRSDLQIEASEFTGNEGVPQVLGTSPTRMSVLDVPKRNNDVPEKRRRGRATGRSAALPVPSSPERFLSSEVIETDRQGDLLLPQDDRSICNYSQPARSHVGMVSCVQRPSSEHHSWEERPGTSESRTSGSPYTTIASSETCAATVVFSEAREDLERLRLAIRDLENGSETSSDGSQNDPDIYANACRRSRAHGTQTDSVTIHGNQGTTTEGQGVPRGSCTNTVASPGNGAPSSFSDTQARKRVHPDDTCEGDTRAATGLEHKRIKLPDNRFICCFHNRPGQECSGTDETVSEVIKKLAEHHNTHVCDRCWSLKEVRGEPDLVHGVTCRDYCLSPQCHDVSRTVGHRHEFDQRLCGRKTSRVRPGDSEAVFRFIYSLVHPDLDTPADVYTSMRSSHLGSISRQGRRKPTREELTVRADDLEKKLEEGEKQNATNAARIAQLEQDFGKQTALICELEKQKRRIIVMLSDALRTGNFPDRGGHLSLRERVREDAPDALSFESHSVLTPATSSGSQRSDTPMRNEATMSEGCQALRESCSQACLPKSSRRVPCEGYGGLDHEVSQGHMSNQSSDHHNIDNSCNDKQGLPTLSTQPTYAAGKIQSRRITSAQGSDPTVDDAVLMNIDQANADPQSIMAGTVSASAGCYALSAEFQHFDLERFNLGNLDAGDFLQGYESTFQDNAISSAPELSLAYDEQIQQI